MFCMECGTKLPDHAKFCFHCGAKVETPDDAPTPEAYDVESVFGSGWQPETPAETRAAPDAPFLTLDDDDDDAPAENPLASIFASLDPVASHSEYYFGTTPLLERYEMAVNRNWVLKHDGLYADTYTLMDETGENQTQLELTPKLRKDEYTSLMGFNPRGVWFLMETDESKKKFLCVNPVSGETVEYPIERQKGDLTGAYIYDDEICYINDVTENKSIVYRQTPYSCVELFTTRKDETVSRVSADATRIAWRFESRRDGEEGQLWYIHDKITGEQTKITAPQDPQSPWVTLIELLGIDLAKNRLLTTVTEYEAQRLGVSKQAIAFRSLKEDPKDGHMLRYSADKSPAVWNVPRSYHFSYFDGVVCYETPHYSQLVRYDRQGAAYELLAGDGHGETEKILVTDKWLYVNYDAYDMLRLPKAFSAFKGYASENPEAFFLFGQHQDFRM